MMMANSRPAVRSAIVLMIVAKEGFVSKKLGFCGSDSCETGTYTAHKRLVI